IVSDEFVSSEITSPTLMIDWLTVKIPFYSETPLNGGNVISTTPDGEVEYMVDKHLKIQGSYDSRVLLRTERGNFPPTEQFQNVWVLSVSGNPVKWFQGHNIFGTSDLPNLVYEMYLALCSKLLCEQPAWLDSAVKSGFYTISRVDINGMYELDSRSDVLSWLRCLEQTGRTRHGTAVSKGTTVYLGKNSERWSIKAYSKGQELESHKLPIELESTSLPNFANNKLRLELTLRSKELTKLGLNVGSEWFNIDIWSLYKNYMGRIEMTNQNVRDDLVFNLKRHVRSTYLLWKAGEDLRTLLPKNTFYRHRRELLSHGVDISVPVPKDDNLSNVVPLRRILSLRPAGVPDWAYGTPLMFEPRIICG
ncbi:hypothetical protein H3N34_19730, partial [Photobacterium damselae subsp. damselae]|uniref:phage/plasmid replication protein, II/X family n=1 Tax=Photobacterium damselae TaxID=38293 RepID=UPI0015F438D5